MSFWIDSKWDLIVVNQVEIAGWLTVILLLLAFVWSMVVEIPKLRRKLTILSGEISTGTGRERKNGIETEKKWSRLDFAFSNSCRRPIKLIDYFIKTHSNDEPTSKAFSEQVTQLNEGDHGSATAFFDGWIEIKDIKSIILVDSMRTEHSFYFYNGRIRNKGLWHLLHFLHVWR